MTETCLMDDLSRRNDSRAQQWIPYASGYAETPRGEMASDEPKELAPGIFFVEGGARYFREGTAQGPAGSIRSLMCNSGWIVMKDEVLLIDSNMPSRSDILLAAIRQTTSKPVRYVLNTHLHGDHTYGNRSIVDRTGATIFACDGMISELRRYEPGWFGGEPGRWEQVAKLRPDVAATPPMLPHVSFSEVLTIGEGNSRIELRFLGHGHTKGDAVAWVPQHNVLFAGDLVVDGPFNIVRDSEMEAWVSTLRAMEALHPQIICPGHGPRGGFASVVAQRAFFEALIGAVKARLAQGMNRAAILGAADVIRAELLADPAAADHVIPHEADLPVLSLQAQIERVVDQLAARKAS